jgi:hypothetical protein
MEFLQVPLRPPTAIHADIDRSIPSQRPLLSVLGHLLLQLKLYRAMSASLA